MIKYIFLVNKNVPLFSVSFSVLFFLEILKRNMIFRIVNLFFMLNQLNRRYMYKFFISWINNVFFSIYPYTF